MRRIVFVALALFVLPAAARADVDPEVQRLLDAKRAMNWNAPLAGTKQKYGHAEALVEAPADKVKDVALDLAHYKDLNKKFANARVIAKEKDYVDLYMRLPVKVGPVPVEQWSVLRFGPAAARPGSAWLVEGRHTKGNLKDAHLMITVRPVDPKHSLLKVDLLLVSTLPAPQSIIDEELRDGALDLVNGLKDRAQGWSGPVVSL